MSMPGIGAGAPIGGGANGEPGEGAAIGAGPPATTGRGAACPGVPPRPLRPPPRKIETTSRITTTPPNVAPPIKRYGSGAAFAFKVRILSWVIGEARFAPLSYTINRPVI